jgi:Predicted metal-dependent hydrolase with the TIM-barrel fold
MNGLIHDYHSHVSLYAALRGLPDLDGIPASPEGRSQAFTLLAAQPREALSLVVGWHTDRLPLSPADLADLPPLLVVNSSLHGFKASPAALPYLRELWPELAERIERGEDAAWAEHKVGALFSFYVRVAGLDLGKLEAFMSSMEALGIGSLDDKTIASEEALELIASSSFADRVIPWATPEVYRSLSPVGRSRCAGLKLFLDGSLGARSAALDEDFLDAPAGPLLYADEELRRLIEETAGYGAGLSVHAIGCRAIEQIVACLETLDRDGVRLPATRLEHVQFIGLDQARRCKALGLALSMQPNFNADSIDYADRLRPRHLAGNNPFRMLIDEADFVPGVDLVFGSDGMPHGPAFALKCCLVPPYKGQRLSEEEYLSGSRPRSAIRP